MPSEPALPSEIVGRLEARYGRNVLTVADINRLEQAARISMGEFLDSEPSVEALPAGRGLMKGTVLAAAAIMVLALFWHLT